MSEYYQKLIDAAISCGASKAVVIGAEKIVLSADFFDACKKNSCGNFGKCWMCPPDVGPITEWMEKIRTFPHALWYQTIGELEDSFDVEGMAEAGAKHAALSQKLRRELSSLLPARTLHLTRGGCGVCERCAKRDNEPCRYPDLAMPSVESCGVNVYKTTEGTGLKYINGPDTVTYFGMILFDDGEENCHA